VNITTGVGWQNGPCVGNTPALAPLRAAAAGAPGYRGLCLQDSPLGVRYAAGVSAFPPGLTAALSWSRSVWRTRGQALGAEFRAKGAHVALGPMANLGRVAEGGRNWEGFGADPWLAGEAAFETVLGMQAAGVQATAKQ
jgi:beta-glucosidase